MSVNPTDFLSISKVIIENENTEISYRVAASRSYYCAFHQTKMTIQGTIPLYNDCGSHEALARYLTSYDADQSEIIDKKTRNRISAMLKSMKTQRHIADYQLIDTFTKQQAEVMIKMTESIVDMLK